MKVSVIIPVFNAENYLDRCLKSVVTAGRELGAEFEILAIDNNSQDGSLKKLFKWAEKCPQEVRVLKCSKPGAGAVRNMGAKEARGKYIWFVDADDEITSDSLVRLVAEAEKTGADAVMTGAEKVFDDGRRERMLAVRPEMEDYRGRLVRYGLGPWSMLILREWWEENGFSFREDIIHEDIELMSALVLKMRRYGAVDEVLYLYYQNQESVVHKTAHSEKHAFDIFTALEGVYARFDALDAVSQYHDALEWFFIWNLLLDGARDFSQMQDGGREGRRQTRKFLRKYFPRWRKNPVLSTRNLKTRVKILLNYWKR
ncbi:glycosyltransferase family 2 protein [Candidatus Saccharibacteria bacterium]|nr:glycosyltransferase family 2 protein [Candidatus Saccharibacteria bacterium]